MTEKEKGKDLKRALKWVKQYLYASLEPSDVVPVMVASSLQYISHEQNTIRAMDIVAVRYEQRTRIESRRRA